MTWTSDNSAVASVSQSGVVSAIAAGSATITVSGASVGQTTRVTAAAKVSVTAPSLQGPASIVLTPLNGSIHVGSLYARKASAQVFDAAGAPMPNEAMSWTTSDPGRLVAAPLASSSASATITVSGTPATGVLLIATAGTVSPVADTILVSTDLIPIARVTVAPVDASGLVTGGPHVKDHPHRGRHRRYRARHHDRHRAVAGCVVRLAAPQDSRCPSSSSRLRPTLLASGGVAPLRLDFGHTATTDHRSPL